MIPSERWFSVQEQKDKKSVFPLQNEHQEEKVFGKTLQGCSLVEG
jgi:hypothetical protein